MPKHIGLILDGNRRYGRLKQLTEPQAIYTNGADRLDDLLDWCVDLGIPAITLWVFSTENLDRAPEEVSGLLTSIEAKLRRLTANPLIHRQRVRVRAVGQLELLPISTQAAVRAAEIATADYAGLQLTLAAACGGRQEITDATWTLLREPRYCNQTAGGVAAQITPAVLGRYMYAPDLPDLDLIHPHQRRDQVVWVSAVAECLQRVLLYRRVLAGVPPHRFSARRACLPAAAAALRAIASVSDHLAPTPDSLSCCQAHPTSCASKCWWWCTASGSSRRGTTGA